MGKGEGCGVKFAKFILIFFNVIFFLTGAVLLAIGLWVRLDEDIWDRLNIYQDVDTDSDSNFEYGAYLLIAIGGFIFVTGFFGCVGACKESACFLGIYIFILVVVMLAEVAAGVLILLYREDIKDEVIKELEDNFDDDYKYNPDTEKWTGFASTLNFIQKEFECCGIKNVNDYDGHDISSNVTNPVAAPSCESGGVQYPPTCFEVKNDHEDEDEDKLTCGDVELTKLHGDACDGQLEDFMDRWAIIFVAIALGFACLQIFGLIFAICLCRVGGKGE